MISIVKLFVGYLFIYWKSNFDKICFIFSGGRIDHAHHGTRAALAVNETVALSDAVNMAMRMTDSRETLLVVTADHSHVMTLAGYSSIDSDILGEPLYRPLQFKTITGYGSIDNSIFSDLLYRSVPQIAFAAEYKEVMYTSCCKLSWCWYCDVSLCYCDIRHAQPYFCETIGQFVITIETPRQEV